MKKYLLFSWLLLTGCAGPKTTLVSSGTFMDVLPTNHDLIVYRAQVARKGVPPATADSRSRAWFRSAGQALLADPQPPMRRKTDLLYQAAMPARQVPDTVGNITTIPRLRFLITVDNQSDTSRIYVTNFEVAGKRGAYQMLEKQPYRNQLQNQWVRLWLTDVDAAVTEMLASLGAALQAPP